VAKATSKKSASGKGSAKAAVKSAAKKVEMKKPAAKAKMLGGKPSGNGSRVELKAAKSSKPAAAPVKAAKAQPVAAKPAKVDKKERPEERRVINVAAPVPTDMKPAKNQSGLKAAELEHYRDLLLAKRRELVGDMSSMEREALQRGGSSNLSNLPMHMADMGTDNYEQEFTLGLMEKDRNLLREINSALAKIQDGTFGLCEGTGKPIGKPRLEAQPWARFSIEWARKLEQRGVR
jgi:RNA polymerase-binding protein DksA